MQEIVLYIHSGQRKHEKLVLDDKDIVFLTTRLVHGGIAARK